MVVALKLVRAGCRIFEAAGQVRQAYSLSSLLSHSRKVLRVGVDFAKQHVAEVKLVQILFYLK